MDNAARQQLQTFIQQQGHTVCNDLSRCRAILKDYCGQYQSELKALVNALNEGIPADLVSSQTSAPPEVLVGRLAKRLCDDLGMREEVARWAVESWAIALEVIPESKVSAKADAARNADLEHLKKNSDSLLMNRSKFTGTVKKVPMKAWVAVGAGVAALGILSYFLMSKTSSRPVFGDGSLTLGVLVTRGNPEENYVGLANYLKAELSSKLGSSVQIEISGVKAGENNSLRQAAEQIKSKKWDVAFTVSPLLSVAAIDNQYSFAARMFPDSKYLEAAIFVVQDSPIQSINDLTPDKTIALGEVGNPISFYMPVYDLYGKMLRIDKDNSSKQAIEKVKSGQADAGVGIHALLQRQFPELRIISRSRALPLAGVYLSPNLTQQEESLVKAALLKAPAEMQKGTAYGAGEKIDYTNFIGITKRVDEILGCADWQQNPVKLYCGQAPGVRNSSTNGIVGKVNGYKAVDAETIQLTLQGKDGQVYQVILPQSVLKQLSNVASLPDLNFKTVEITGVQPTTSGGSQELQIINSKQIKVLQ
ncbi:MAG: phosphate/phosphite/phosphonate ABC transporter substrate-binding protein [Stenomitos rutilans HA7619-LM2]|jgi:serine/threonine-protein kinase|nr:phosphate/phosphite/phosphonate ABC transporter substrate-binding protein [Stenomitos rutilans HA7619-LM2]